MYRGGWLHTGAIAAPRYRANHRGRYAVLGTRVHNHANEVFKLHAPPCVKIRHRALGSVCKSWYPDMEVEEVPDAA